MISNILLKKTFTLTLFQLPLVDLIDTSPSHMTEESILITFFQLELYECCFPTLISVQMCWLFLFVCFFWETENTASHSLRINRVSDVTCKSYHFFFRSWIDPDKLFIISIFSCISSAIFYIRNKRLGQKFCSSFIIISLHILVCFPVTTTTEGSSNIFTLSPSFYITPYSFV